MFQYDPGQASDAIPAGDYLARVVEAEEKLSSNDNEMLKVTFEIISNTANGDESQRGRKCFDHIVYSNPFAHSTFKKMFASAAMPETATIDKDTFVGKIMKLRLKVEQSAEYGDTNRISYLKRTEQEHVEEKPGSNEIPF